MVHFAVVAWDNTEIAVSWSKMDLIIRQRLMLGSNYMVIFGVCAKDVVMPQFLAVCHSNMLVCRQKPLTSIHHDNHAYAARANQHFLEFPSRPRWFQSHDRERYRSPSAFERDCWV